MNIIIYGFNYPETEKIIDEYTEGTEDYTSVYLNAGVHREDKLICHLRIKAEEGAPYIFAGEADVLRAKTAEDAYRFSRWVRLGGEIKVCYNKIQME